MREGYFLSQPDSLSQADMAVLPGGVLSQAVTDSVSLSSILLFMQVQYLAMISTLTFLAPALSLTHFATHFASSGPASVGLADATQASIASDAKISRFRFMKGLSIGEEWMLHATTSKGKWHHAARCVRASMLSLTPRRREAVMDQLSRTIDRQ